jgi:MFS family permease
MKTNEPSPAGLRVIVPLGSAQLIAWAASYYLPAVLAEPIARDLGLQPSFIFGALSGALAITGLLGPLVGSMIDRAGGRNVLAVSNLLLAAGLVLLANAHGIASLIAAWALLGVGMAAGLYEPAFASLTRLYGFAARRPITGITLIAGFASTVGWPATAWLDARYGWRTACLVWAAAQVLLALPLNLMIPRVTGPVPVRPAQDDAEEADVGGSEFRLMAAVAFVFATTGFVASGLSALMPALLMRTGTDAGAAILASTLVGPAQVVARIVEAQWLIKFHPLISTRLATLMHPAGAIAMLTGGPLTAGVFAAFYGAGNGILTIARGTLPLALFGPLGFGRRLGFIALPARVSGAIAPFLLGVMLDWWGGGVIILTCALSLAAFVVLMMMSGRPQPN